MAGPDWLLHTLYTALLGQTLVPTDHPQLGTGPSTISPSGPLVHTPYGDIQGFQRLSTLGVTVSSFLGIPFAKPPVGDLRFHEPMPASKWSGVRDGTKFRNECIQMVYPEFNIQLGDEPLAKTEDCLYLNVYKPELSPLSNTGSSSGNDSGSRTERLPVMVWIHGGGFRAGAGSQFDGMELAAHGVIVVTINYRLDIFGFLSNGDDVIPGNYGLLDQVMALKWVKECISSFGGDPDKVTAFGQSAGSGSVSLLLLSPLAKGLFRGAIMQSGTSLSPWATQFPADRLSLGQKASLVAARVGCVETEAVKELECLRKVDAARLFNASSSIASTLRLGIMHKPCVETKFGFLPDRPSTLWTRGKFNRVDTIRGFNKAEYGWALKDDFSLSLTESITKIKNALEDFAIVDIDQLINAILRENNITSSTDEHSRLLKVVNALTDINFKGPSIVEGNLESKMAPEKNHFMYEFDYKPSRSLTPAWMPMIHGEDLQFVFGPELVNQIYKIDTAPSANDLVVTKRVQAMWTNFAKYGSPGVPSSSLLTTSSGGSMAQSGSLGWSPYIGDRNASGMRIGLSNQEVSFKNSTSARVFQEVLSRLDTFLLPNRFIVG